MTAWARIAQENSEQSCGNDGAMESQHQAFHSSLGISQKNARFPHSHSSGDGLFDWTKKDSKKTEGRLHKSLDTAMTREDEATIWNCSSMSTLRLGHVPYAFHSWTLQT